MSTLTAREQARFNHLAKKGGFKVTAKVSKREPAKKVTKGSQPVGKGALTRKAWNKTLTTKARLAGGDTYKRVIAAWAEVQQARTDGYTPDEVIAQF